MSSTWMRTPELGDDDDDEEEEEEEEEEQETPSSSPESELDADIRRRFEDGGCEWRNDRSGMTILTFWARLGLG